MKKKQLAKFLLFAFIVFSCSQTVDVANSEDSTTNTDTVIINTATPVIEIASATPQPVIISAGNVDNLTQTNRIGNGVVNQALWTPDGNQILFASTTGIYKFDIATLTQQDFIETSFDVERMVMSKEGDFFIILSGLDIYSFNGVTINQIDISEVRQDIENPEITSIALSPDKKYIALGGRGKVYVLNLVEEKMQYIFEGSNGLTNSIVFSPDGLYLVAGGDQNTVGNLRMWNIETGALFISKDTKFPISNVAFSPDSTLIASASVQDEAIIIWDRQSGGKQIAIQSANISNLAFSADGKYIIAAGSTEDRQNGRVSVWNVEGELLREKNFDSGNVVVSISPDEQNWVLIDSMRQVYIEKVNAQSTIVLSDFFTKQIILGIDISSTGEIVATMQDSLYFVQPQEEKSYSGISVPMGNFVTTSVAFSPNGNSIAVIDSGSLKILNSKNQIQVYNSTGGDHYRLAFSPDGKYLATSSKITEQSANKFIYHNFVNIWDSSNWRLIRSWEIQTQNNDALTRGLAFSPDGSILVTGTNFEIGSLIRLWRVSDGSLLREVKTDYVVFNITYSGDGKWLGVSSVGAGIVDIWDVEELTPKCKLEEASRSIAFSPDNTLVATGASFDVKVWDIATCENLQRFSGHTDIVTDVKFSKNQSNLITGSLDGTIRIWAIE